MYTQCPECQAVFEITAADLAVAGGFVRCGQCNRSFDALNSLTDKVPEEAPVAAGSGGSATRHSLVRSNRDASQPPAGTTSHDHDTDETAADVSPDPETAGVTVAAQELEADESPQPGADEDTGDESDGTAEAGGVAPDLQESDAAGAGDDTGADNGIVADSQAAGLSAVDPETQPAPATDDADSANNHDEDEDEDEILLDESYRPPHTEEDDDDFFDDDWDDEDNDTLVAEDGAHETHGFAIVGDVADADDAHGSEPASATDDDEAALFSLPLPELTALDRVGRTGLPEKLEGGAAVHDASAQTIAPPAAQPSPAGAVDPVRAPSAPRANDAFDAKDARDLRNYLSAPKNRVATAMWGAGAALMAVLLVAQIVHRNRGDLIIHPRIGPLVQSIYGTVGAEVKPNWRIGEYKVVGQARMFEMPPEDGVADDPTALRFVAIIANGAKLPQPPPMVRLTLRDRWGDPTGIRDFTPPEYLAESSLAGELLEPGQRLRVVLNLRDPGNDVDGFDFDMCLPDGAGTLRCAGEPAG